MRVLVAPDEFGGTLSAVEAAQALVAGWREMRPGDELVGLPLSDGGPGFAACLLASGLAEVLAVPDVEDPLARPVTAVVVRRDGMAYVESAQACGLHLLTAAERDPGRTTTYGVGRLVLAAVADGARRVVVGLGGSATNDGGAGLLAALGLAEFDRAGTDLAAGGLALTGVGSLQERPPLGRIDGMLRLLGQDGGPVGLVAATDVDAPLLGPAGAAAVFGPQKGAGPEQVAALDAALEHWADLLEGHVGGGSPAGGLRARAAAGKRLRDLPGAGAAGGLGFALLALGAERVPGLDVVAEAVGLDTAVAAADLVVTGEGRFDASSLRGKVVSGVAARARRAGVPCLVVAGQVGVGAREASAAGVDASYSLAEAVGLASAMGDPRRALAGMAARVARDWSR